MEAAPVVLLQHLSLALPPTTRERGDVPAAAAAAAAAADTTVSGVWLAG